MCIRFKWCGVKFWELSNCRIFMLGIEFPSNRIFNSYHKVQKAVQPPFSGVVTIPDDAIANAISFFDLIVANRSYSRNVLPASTEVPMK